MPTLFHYTNRTGHNGILVSNQLLPSTKARNPREARHGDGQYLTDIPPGTMSGARLSRALRGNPFEGRRFTHYVEIDVTGLQVIMGAPHAYVVLNARPLDLSARIVRSGTN
jgi:hypothetical protein